MVKLDAGTTLKRLRNRYRLVVMNDDTYEEVVTFKLSRLSVYIMLSTIFVVLVGLTVALIVFTPQNAQYIDRSKKVLSGAAIKLDTTRLNLPPAEISND